MCVSNRMVQGDNQWMEIVILSSVCSSRIWQGDNHWIEMEILATLCLVCEEQTNVLGMTVFTCVDRYFE